MRTALALALTALLEPASPAQDGSFTGVWETQFGAHKARWEVASDGEYVSRLIGPGDLPGEHGYFEPAANGRWRLRATNRREDEGTFKWLDPNTVSMTGRLGTAVWKRTSGQVRLKKLPGAPTDPAGFAPLEAAALARAEAEYWQPDAKLAVVNASCSVAGRTVSANFLFNSPASRQGAVVVVARRRATVFPMPLGTDDAPLPDSVGEVAAAIQAARLRQGFAPLERNGMNAVTATLKVWRAPGAASGKCGWFLDAVGASSRAMTDAFTGDPLDWVELTGYGALLQAMAMNRAREEEFRRGREHKVQAPNFDRMMQIAGDYLKEYRGEGWLPYRIDLWGGEAGGSLVIDSMEISYVRPGVPKSSAGVCVTPRRVGGGPGGGAFGLGVNDKPEPMPKVLSAEEAFRKLWAMKPNVPSDCVVMQLLKVGAQAYTEPATYPAQRIGEVLSGLGEEGLQGRWVWRHIAVRPGGFGGKAGGAYHGTMIPIDAVSGRPLETR